MAREPRMQNEVAVDQFQRTHQAANSDIHDRAQSLPVPIVGMHRSGTSMVAKLLQRAGLNLGPDSVLMPPAEENPEGFYEHLEFVRLNDEVLNEAGAGWDCPPAAAFDWTSPVLEPFRDRARALAHSLEPGGPWGWKDPRTSLTLPFWRSAIGPLRAIVVVRNPLEVVTSLHRRNGFSLALSLTLWRVYAERILADTEPRNRLVTHYDAYFLEPDREIGRALAFIGLDQPADGNALVAATAPDLRHHRKTARDLVEHGFPGEVIDLYRRLSEEAAWQEEAFDATAFASAHPTPAVSQDVITRGAGRVDLLRVENIALRRNIEDFSTALAGRELRVAELETALQTHEGARAELDGKVAERDAKVAERNRLIIQKDQTVAAQQHQLESYRHAIDKLQQDVAVMRDQLVEGERQLAIASLHERELRGMLTDLQALQLQRDAEIMGTLGAVLSRHAPGAPAAIYHRKMIAQVRQHVAATIPAPSRLLVATYGDDALLVLGDHQAEPFPRSAPGISADYTDISDDDAIAQLEALRGDGAEFLVVPSPALPWLANHPGLSRHIEDRYAAASRERGVATIYALSRQQGQIPA
jgi:hypothetical protein